MVNAEAGPSRPLSPSIHRAGKLESSSEVEVPPILRLPPELFDTFLQHVPPQELQSTALALSRVFPDHPISRAHLWKHIVARNPVQMVPMWKKMREMKGKRKDGGPEMTRTFSMETWKGDADILNNVLRCVPDLRVLMLNIGTNFSPEHLEEMFEDPRLDINRMEMRFRPYVEQASYYQFLKGSYFDTAIETLYRRWPAVPSFTHLSIVQDPPPRQTAPPTAIPSMATTAVNSQATSLTSSMTDLTLGSDESSAPVDQSTPPTSADESVRKGYTGHGPFPYLADKLGYAKPKTFAQPIVFFDIKCIARFGASAVASNLTHLRFRVPSRDIAFVLLGPGGVGGLFPSLRYLDISTTNLRMDAVLSTLLKNYINLEHLVIDRVNLFGFAAKDRGAELCRDLGGMCVSACLSRGKDRERRIAAWEVGERTRAAEAEADRLVTMSERRTPNHAHAGQREEAETAAAREASARAAEERERQIAIARSRRGHRSAGHSTFSLRDRPSRASQSALSTIRPSIPLPPQEILYLVLPPLPTLKSINIGGEAHGVSTKSVMEWEDEFHAGWREGLSKVLGWAGHIAERYERALRKAEEWRIQELQGIPKPPSSATAKGKAKTPAPVRTKPPMDIRLLRYPNPDEKIPMTDRSDPTNGLIEVDPEESRDYLTPYFDALARAEAFANDRSRAPPCVLCTVPDCEGPARKGAEPGERVDGRGGMDAAHRPGCGHALGRRTWGWEGVVP